MSNAKEKGDAASVADRRNSLFGDQIPCSSRENSMKNPGFPWHFGTSGGQI
jgi:hypothetical protein